MRAAVLAVLVAALLAAPAEAGTLYIHAHRGGPASYGAPENSLEAFERAAADGFVVELDVKLAKDRVPVVIHDDALDRTTTCTGPVAARTAADLRDCVLKGSARGEPVPRLTDALDLLRRTGARANVEIKNLPTDGDYEPGTAYAEAVIAVLRAAALPSRQLIVQSFDPQNLQAAEAALPGVDTSLLTLGPLNPGSPVFAKGTGYEYVSPEYGTGLSPELVADAHAGGKRVVPYTVDTPEGVRAAAAAGIDEIITNDPRMARRALKEVEPPAAIPPPPSPEACRSVRASRTLAPAEAFDAAGGASTPRVFAMQFKQDARHVDDYAAYRTKIECLIREWVVPRMVPGRPTVVAFNEDVGLATIATGSRGAAAREAVTKPGGPSCEGAGAPCATLAALGAIRTSYGKEVTAYRGRFERMSPIADAFVAATDTFARGWMQTFCDMARRYGVYILGSNNQAPFRESTDPSEIAAFRDPDLPAAPPTVYVATSDAVFNEVFLWGPSDVREEGPRPLRNVVASNKKVPLTPIEEQLQLRNGPATGPDAVDNLRPFALPGTGARIGFATSLPAFVYGSVPAGGDPCADVTKTYMRCLDALGANLVMQDEANPGRWAGPGGRSPWQPLEWMDSTWRAVSDPSVGFAYNVTPHLVGNLADLAFDGQTAITQRGLDGGAGCRYVGNGAALDEDPAPFRAYAGTKREFLALVPWVAPDGPRDALRAVAARLAPGSGDKLENDYVETAIAADLPFPPNPARVGCAGADGVARPAPGSRRPPALRRLRVPARQRLRRLRRRGVLVKVTVRRAARVRLAVFVSKRTARRLRLRRARIGRRTVRLRRAGTHRVRIRLNARARRALRAHPPRRLRLRVKARAGSRTLRATARLRGRAGRTG